VNAAEQVVEDRKPAPEFMLPDAEVASIKLFDYKSKVVLLNFWPTRCGPCNIEIPWFVAFQNKYKDRGLAVLASLWMKTSGRP
jgi:cytochrome c biogenesis protein CcmG/thiol:disulfide interchange protein DsbE